MKAHEDQKLAVLRSLDKADKLGRAGVVELLQKPFDEFGANLDPITAELLGQYVDCSGASNEQTLRKLNAFLPHAEGVRRRLDLIVLLDATPVDGVTGWDFLLEMRPNEDGTWRDGGRPANIAWALDDIASRIGRLAAVQQQGDAR